MVVDCAIIGGGPAGLNAALLLGRARRKVLLFDDDKPRNAVTHHSHGGITRDGVSPAEFRAFVKRMNERALEELMRQLSNCQQALKERQKALEEKNQQLTEKDTQFRLIKQELRQLEEISIIQFALGAISALASGLGINQITASPPIESGWLVVGLAICLQIASLLTNLRERSRKGT